MMEKVIAGVRKVCLWFIVSSLLLAASSCVTYEKCQDKFGTNQEPVTITVRDTVYKTVRVITDPDAMFGIIDQETFGKMQQLIDSLTFESTSGRSKIAFWKDKYDRIRFKAECKSETIYQQIQIPVEVQADCPPVTHFEPPKPKPDGQFVKALRWIGIDLLLIMIVIIVASIFLFSGHPNLPEAWKRVRKFISTKKS